MTILVAEGYVYDISGENTMAKIFSKKYKISFRQYIMLPPKFCTNRLQNSCFVVNIPPYLTYDFEIPRWIGGAAEHSGSKIPKMFKNFKCLPV